MKIKELKAKTEVELLKMLNENRNHLLDLRFKVSLNQQKNVRELRVARKNIAQISTIINQNKVKQ